MGHDGRSVPDPCDRRDGRLIMSCPKAQVNLRTEASMLKERHEPAARTILNFPLDDIESASPT